MNVDVKPFFVAGGTVPPGSASYVERAADRELFEALLAGEYCYVLSSRQMGKSSLAVRTIGKLEASGVRCAFVDLTRLGATDATPERWYAGLLAEIGRALGMRSEAMAYLRANQDLPATTRIFSFLRDIALVAIDGPVVLMIDEIDAVRTLPFSVDDLFAGLRELWNARASDARMERLTICLLGAALPSDLISDPRRTPFNIGRRVELRDFSLSEAKPFASELGEAKLKRVFYWTGGHPFLTQALCAGLAAAPLSEVDRFVRERYLDARARDTDTNLSDVARRLLGEGDSNVNDSVRADTLSLYERMLRGKEVTDDEANTAAARIKMSGTAKVENGLLKPRNRIYATAFGTDWTRSNLPGKELRRQRRAFLQGVFRTSAVATVVVAALAALAWNNLRLANIAEQGRVKARYDAYVETMRTLPLMLQQNDLSSIDDAIDGQKDEPARGWEWAYWHHLTHTALRRIPPSQNGNPVVAMAVNPDGRRLATKVGKEPPVITDVVTGLKISTQPSGKPYADLERMLFSSRGSRLITITTDGLVSLFDVETGRLLREKQFPRFAVIESKGFLENPTTLTYSRRSISSFDVDALEFHRIAPVPFGFQSFSTDINHGVLSWLQPKSKGGKSLVVYGIKPFVEKLRIDVTASDLSHLFWMRDGSRVFVPGLDGRISLVDLKSKRTLWTQQVSNKMGNVWQIRVSPDEKQVLVTGSTRECALCNLLPHGVQTVKSYPETSFAEFMTAGRFLTWYWDVRVYDTRADNSEIPYRLGSTGSSHISSEGRVSAVDSTGAKTLDLMNPGAAPQSPHVATGAGLTSDRENKVWFRERSTGDKVDVLDGVSGQLEFTIPTTKAPPSPIGDRTVEGQFVALKTDDAIVTIVSRSGHEFRNIRLDANVTAVRFSRGGRFLAIADDDGWLTVYRTEDVSRPAWKSFGHSKVGFLDIEFSPDDKRIAAARYDDEAEVFDSSTGHLEFPLKGHSQICNAVTWSPDGKRLATGSSDQTVRVWDASNGRELGIIGYHDSQVDAVRFFRDGRTLASISQDGVTKLWMTDARR
jgi:WD40 repeat protein